MPRYFFDAKDESVLIDSEGIELADHAAARVKAIIYSGEIMSKNPGVLWDGGEFKIEVRNESGARLFTIVSYAINEPASETP